jgi:predicted benzoate:H+ symporter BenE
MVILGTLLGITAEWWGVIFGVIGVIVSVTQAVRKRRQKKAESLKP